MKRDPKVELMRIIACAIVVGTHTYLPSVVSGQADIGRVFMSCVLADGVAVFWFINGFFLFKNKSYGSLLRHTLKNIIVPMVCVSLFYFYLGGWITDGETLAASVSHTPDEYKSLLNGVLSWNNAVPDTGYLWYLYVYVFIMLLYPVLKAFADYLDGSAKREKAFLIISAAILLFNDISGNKFGSFSHHTVNALFPAAIEILWGHIIYKYRDRFAKKRFMIISIAAFLVFNVARTLVQMKNYSADTSDKSALYWYTLFGLFCSLSVVVFCLATGLQKERRTKTNIVICSVASYTMTIYLVHIIVRNFLTHYGVLDMLQEIIVGGRRGFLYEVAYDAAVIVIIFAISLVIAVLIRCLINLFKKIFSPAVKAVGKKAGE